MRSSFLDLQILAQASHTKTKRGKDTMPKRSTRVVLERIWDLSLCHLHLLCVKNESLGGVAWAHNFVGSSSQTSIVYRTMKAFSATLVLMLAASVSGESLADGFIRNVHILCI